jgi:deazaflavin-dependent oxidoreductase (nitroreductase family)
MSDAEAEATKQVNDWNKTVIEEFRSNDGKVGGQFENADVLLLQTKGAKSGVDRVNPMMYLEEDGKIYVFASYAGADKHPDWFHNIKADDKVMVELGTEKYEATAEPVPPEERDRIYAIMAAKFENFAEYEKKTTRVIPVVELVR